MDPFQNTFLQWFLLCGLLLGCSAPSDMPGARNTELPKSADVASVPSTLPLSEQQWREGWISLFDGETLFGWETTGEVPWQVQDQVIVAATGEVGFLYTTSTFSNYVLHLEFRCHETTNSGVFLHMPASPQDPARDCYEVNIAPADNPFPTGSLVKRQRVDTATVPGDWNTLDIKVDGPAIHVKVNGVVALEYQDENQPALARGHIGLQHNQGKVEFRDIRIKPLHVQSLFNGRDLTGWTILPDMQSEFRVTPEGYLHVTGGKGQLETEGQFADFILQLNCQTRAKGLNSGIFFRCIPGDLWMGYESQIHHGYVKGDRSHPSDCGTGGIFRRQDARRIVADDLQWFTKTIIADGPHMAVWVNGCQVSDWTDNRPAHENPRKGRRTEAGTIILQGHDPTTDLFFENFGISILHPRVVRAGL